jgi:hypothetical protein
MPADGGSTRPPGHPCGASWTAEEDDIIRAAWRPGMMLTTLAQTVFPRLTGRSIAAIMKQASRVLDAGIAPRKKIGTRRARAINPKRTSKAALDFGRALFPPAEMEGYVRPKTRGDCLPGGCNEARPCPWVSCTHHLYLSVTAKGSLTLDHGDVDVDTLTDTCALDIAERPRPRTNDGVDADHHATLDEIGRAVGVTRERARQIIDDALSRIADVADPAVVAAFLAAHDAASERTGSEAEALAPSLPAPVVRRYLPVVNATPTPRPEAPALDLSDDDRAAAHALAATRAASLSPRTWLRRAAARRAK